MPRFVVCLCVLLAVLGGFGARVLAQDEGKAPAQAPEPWYEREIRAFEAADKEHPPAKGIVLFTGSSSVRLWKTLAEDMAPAPVLNRGFGGSKTREVLEVMDRIVFPYEPSVIVYYCGDNDLGETNTDSQAAADGFIEFVARVHERLPKTRVLYMSIKSSVARWSNWEAMHEANEIVRKYAESHEYVGFMDIGKPLLGADGTPDPALFEGDGLHVNAKGYERWTAVVRPRVLEAWRARE